MTATSSDDFLEGAEQIAGQLAATAIWHDGRCNWVAPRLASPVSYAALDAHLYAGTAGVALFLAEAAAVLGEPHLATLARGAIRHALTRSGREEGGLYVGPLGVVVAAARIARLLDDDELKAEAGQLLARWRAQSLSDDVPDVLNGSAGAILALLAISSDLDASWLAQATVDRGEALLDRAERSADGWSWAAPGKAAQRNLCGLSHGAGGIGLALMELFSVTSDTRFRVGAERAFDYERSWRQRGGGLWPDLRGIWRRAERDAPLPTSPTWCNGAPGALLVRLRCERIARPRDREAIDAALAQTLAIAQRLVSDGFGDTCLCHGAAGIADVLLMARDDSELSRHICSRLRISAVTHPGLLTGLAGIGMLHLRLVNEGIGSPLSIHPGVA